MAESARYAALDAEPSFANGAVLKRAVIHIGGPGLGDSMSYRTLPEGLIKQGCADEVIICEPDAGWRNPEVRMIWERDKFVAGFTTTEPASKFKRYYEFRAPRSFASWMMGMENQYGLMPVSGWPSLPWEPKGTSAPCGAMILDPRSSSQSFPASVIEEYVKKVCWQLDRDPANVLVIDSPYSAQYGRGTMPNNRRISIAGLDELASAIAMCDIMFTVESGTHMFASAVKGAYPTPSVYALFTAAQFNDRIFHMSNVCYAVTGFQQRDWHHYNT